MCGITGILHRDVETHVDAASLRRMVSTLRHRGPDDEGIHIDGPVGLAARRLKVIDPVGGVQPFVDAARRLAIVFNGEIYNAVELREHLVAKGQRFSSRSDTEVVLRAYAQYGEECVQRLRGMFAFAIADGPGARLFLARDRIGIKPLYYTWDGRRFVFGSEIKAIVEDPTVSREIDPVAIDEYLTFNYIPAPRSIFASIRKLRPGHWLRVTSSAVVEREYWDLVFEPDERGSAERYVTELRERLTDSVRCHLVSDVPVGAFLSGGVDSSVMTTTMAALGEGSPHTMSIGFDDPAFDERPYARAVAQQCAAQAREWVLRPQAVGVVGRLAWHYDEPFADSSMVPTYHLSHLAREHSTVCLAGDGGDEVFAGYPRFAAFERQAADDVGAAERGYFDSRTWITAAMKRRLYRQPLMKAVAGYDPFSILQTYFDRTREWETLSRIQYVETKTYLAGDLLTKVDRASMAHGLEVRVPLLDHRLVEFAARIPARYKLRDGCSKWILKHAFRDRLPAVVLTRPKMGFSMPLASWFQTELKECFEARVFAADAFLAQLFDLQPVREWWAEHQAGVRDYNRFFWSLVMLEAWAQRFVIGGQS